MARVCIAKPSPGGNGVAGHSAPDLPTHRIAYAATLHSARQRCAMTAQLYVSTRFPAAGCLCTDRCQRCDRSLRVPTDQSWTQTDRYNRCSECVRAFARAGATGVGTRVHAKPSPGGDGVAGHFAPDLPTHRIAYAATLHSARQRCAMAVQLYALAYRLRVHRTVPALRPIVARANRSVVDTDRSVQELQ